MLTMSCASGSSSRVASRSASDTFIGKADPTSAMPATRSGAAPAASRAISDPMLWPIKVAREAPAASSTASTHCAIASMLASAGPALRP